MKRSVDPSLENDLASYQLLVESAKDYAIFMLSESGHVLTWNIGAERLYGYIANEVIGQHFSGFYPAEEVEAGQLERLLQPGQNLQDEEEGWHMRSDGSRFWAGVLLTALYDPDGKLTGFVSVIHDMTERKRYEDGLRTANATLEARIKQALYENKLILENSPDLICAVNAEGRFTQVNAACEKLLGYQPAEMLGRQFLDFVYQEDHGKASREAKVILSGQATTSLENRWVRKDGALVHLAWSAIWSDEAQQYFSIGRDVTEARRAQQALRQSEEEFRSTFELAPVGISHTALNGELRHVNEAYCRMVGYSMEELVQLRFEAISHPDDRVYAQDALRRLQSGEMTTISIEKRYLRKDGETVWARLTATLKRDGATGEPCHYITIAEDITGQKQAMETAHAAEQQVRTILESISDAFFSLDNDWRFTYLNARAEQLLERPRETLLGHNVWEEFPEAMGDTFEREYRKARDTRQAVEFETFFTPLATWFAVTAYPHPEGLSVYFDDITERKQLEAALTQSEEMFRSTFEQAAVGISYTSLDGTMQRVNRRCCDILGYSEEELKRLTYLDITHPDDRQLNQDRIRQMFAGEIDSFCIEKRFFHKNHQVVWVELTSTLKLHPVSQAPEGFIAIIQDITQRKQVEEKLRQAEEHFRLLVESTEDYAIIRLDKYGNIASWNPGAEKILGYREQEIVGQHFSRFYTAKDSMNGEPQRKLSRTIRDGRAENEHWQVRRDGSRFWSNGVINAIYDDNGNVQGFVKIMRDITERKMAEDRTLYLAHHDVLTGLPNRAHFSLQLPEILADARRDLTGVALLMLDLDRFKAVNDTLGHDVGDLLLKEVANRLLMSVRETDTVARLGGDEFIIIQTNVMDKADAATLAQKIVTELGRPYLLNGQEIQSGTSIGITLYPGDGQDVGQLLKNADLALYRAKDQGRHNYQFYAEEMQAAILARQRMERDLRHALENQEFSLVFQPQIDLATWQVSGVEALLRWHSPHLQLLAPDAFLDLAHEAGLIVPIGEWVLREACRQNRAWQDDGIPPFRMGVNFSAREVEDPQFTERIRRILAETRMDAAHLEVEITEGQLIKDREGTLTVLGELQKMNIGIAADDFGNGLTNLKTLKRFEVDKLKIDRTVIEHVAQNRHDAAIAAAIIKLGVALNVRVVAEGVETFEQLAFLQQEGCTHAQGFLFTPPVSARALAVLLREGKWARQMLAPS